MNEAEFYAFMKQRRYGVVSSASSSGGPQSALMGIAVTSKLEIVFDTLTTSRKYMNLIANPCCAFVVGWEGEQTVQFEGIAREAVGEELLSYREIYFSAWPECREHLQWPGITYFVVRPRWIRYSDYGQSPPLIDEIGFGE